VVETGGHRYTNIQTKAQSIVAPWHKFRNDCHLDYICVDLNSLVSKFYPQELCENCVVWDTKPYRMTDIRRFIVGNCRSCLQKEESCFIRNVGNIHQSPRRYTQTIFILTVSPVVSLYHTYIIRCLLCASVSNAGLHKCHCCKHWSIVSSAGLHKYHCCEKWILHFKKISSVLKALVFV
jgi:hypothetical protein